MHKALGSRKKVVAQPDGVYQEFLSHVRDLLDSPEVQSLADFPHHYSINRLQHCINVAYYSFLFCRRFGYDEVAAARAGLLHDLFFYDMAKKKDGPHHTYLHPAQALQNAETLTALTDMERDIIFCHMWPRAKLPRYFESFVVSGMDKTAWFVEVAICLARHRRLRKSLAGSGS